MKYYSQRDFKWAALLVVLSLPWVHSVDERDNQSPRETNITCQDGKNTVGEKTCCRCAAGQRLIRLCEYNAGDRVCDHCVRGKTYNSQPNTEFTCEQCTSCAQPNANLEVKEECTIAKDTVCRCKQGYYCNGGTCTVCNPCEMCEGQTVKTSCTLTNNTVCEEQTNGWGIAAGVSISVAIVVLLVVAGVIWRKKCLCFARKANGGTELPEEPARLAEYKEIQEGKPLLEGMDLSPHAPAIAKVLGWKDMRDIALATGTSAASIDNHLQNNPGNAEERTFQLLLEWIQKQGKSAPEELVKRLKALGRTATVEAVMKIIQNDGSSPN